jgi:hypothetical protein
MRAERTERGHLRNARDLADLPFERRRHRRGYGFGAGASVAVT